MSSPLPPNIAAYLRRYLRRRRFFTIIRSLAFAVSLAAALTLAACLIDRLFALSAAVRLALLLINLFLAFTLIARPVWRWLFQSANWNAVAADIERRDARFNQILQTIVSQSLAAPDRRGSQDLLDHLQLDLNTRLQSIRPASLHSFRPLLFDIAAALCILAIGASLTRLPWLDLPRLLHRYTTPWVRISPATTTHIDITPGDADVIAGKSLTIRAVVTGQGDSAVTLHASEGAAIQHFTMAPAGDAFTFAFPAVDRDFRYNVTAGDATSTTYDVKALSRPAVASFEIHYEYPAGLYKPPAVVTSFTGRLEAPAGTRTEILLHLTEAFTHAQLVIDGRVIEATGEDESLTRLAEISLEHDTTYDIRLLSRHRIPAHISAIPVHIIPDNPPTVRLTQPISDVATSPWDSLAVSAAADDDFGLEKWDILLNGANLAKELPLPLTDHPHRARGSLSIDLSELNLSDGQTITLTPTATDGANHTTHGSPVSILIVSTSIDAAARQRAADLARAADQSQSLAAAMNQAKAAFDAARSVNPNDGLRLLSAGAEARRQLTAAAQIAGGARISLDRTIARSPTQSLSMGLLSLVDDAAYCESALDAASAALQANSTDTNWARDRIEQAAARAQHLRDAAQTLSRAQIATLLSAQAADLARLSPAAATQPAAQSLRANLAAIAGQLHLDPADAPAANNMIAEAAKLLAQLKAVDFSSSADEFSADLPATGARRPFLAQRLQAAAQAESLRPDAELVRAADLQLASRAAAASSVLSAPQLDHFKQAFPAAIRALSREHDARRLANLPPEWDAIAAAGDAARQTLRDLASPAPAHAAEAVLSANAQIADRPSKATTQPAATPLPPSAGETSRLAAEQAQLREKPPADAGKSQDALAQQIEKLRHDTQPAPAADHRAALARSLSQADNPARDIEQRIGRLRDLAQAKRDLEQRAARAQQAVGKATPQSIQPAEELAADLAARSDQAAKDLAAAKANNSPDESEKLNGALRPFAASPSSVDQVTKELNSAMAAQSQAADQDPAGESAATARAEKAAQTMRDLLDRASDQLLQQDPLAVASAASAAAGDAMKSGAPAASSQQLAGAALARAHGQIVHAAASSAVAKLPGVAAILSESTPGDIAAAAQWTLTSAHLADSHATLNSPISVEYQDAIRAYFEALGRKP